MTFNSLWLPVLKIRNLILLCNIFSILFLCCAQFYRILIRDENLSAQAVGLDGDFWIAESYEIFQSFNEP